MDDYVEDDSEKESVESNDSADKASRGLSYEWKNKIDCKFGSEEEFQAALPRKDEYFKKNLAHTKKRGSIQNYLCKTPGCKYMLRAVVQELIFEECGKHEHALLNNNNHDAGAGVKKVRGLNAEQKLVIDQAIESKRTGAKVITSTFDVINKKRLSEGKDELPIPSFSQISSYVHYEKQKMYGKTSDVSLGSIEQYVNVNFAATSDDNDTVICLQKHYDVENLKFQVRSFLSTYAV